VLSLVVYAAPFVLGLVLLVAIASAFSEFRRSRRAPYFRIRRDSARSGWRWLLIALLAGGGVYAAYIMRTTLEPPNINNLLPPLPASGPTPTFDLDSILTTTPGTEIATRNPLASPPTITPTIPATTPAPTPFIATIDSPVTASPEASIEIAAISTSITADLQPSNPGTFFSTGQPRIYFFLKFKKMANGLSWSRALALDGKVIRTVSAAWDQGEAGTAYYWFEAQGGFPVGSYQIQFYIGDKLASQGVFTLR
jgi:hypothetical protein